MARILVGALALVPQLCEGLLLSGRIAVKRQNPGYTPHYHVEGKTLARLGKQCPPPVDDSSNLCVDGHIVPEFILLGVQRAATASFSYMLNCPEMVWPKHDKAYIFDNESAFWHGKPEWLSQFPECLDDRRIVAIDDAPEYMYTKTSHQAARRINQYYGDESKRIKFGVILREPLSRIQSMFHHSRQMGWCSGHTNDGFVKYVQHFIDNATDDPCDFVKNTNYTQQFESYLDFFQMKQFIVVPYLDLIQPTHQHLPGEVILSVWQNLGFNVSNKTKVPALVHHNSNNHPKLVKELSWKLIDEARTLLHKTVRVNSLAKFLTRGPVLPTYTGSPHNWTQVSAWLEERW